MIYDLRSESGRRRHKANVPAVPGGTRHTGQTCETNPISLRRVARASCPWSRIMGKMPMPRGRRTASPGARQRLGDNCAKQSQSPATPGGLGLLYKQTQFLSLCRSGDRRSRESEACETNPIQPGLGSPPTSERCKTNPIHLVGRGRGDRNAQNEANFRRPRYPTIPIFHCFSLPIRCRSCKTNPIPVTVPLRRLAFPGG